MDRSLLIILSITALVLVVGRWKPVRLTRRAWSVRHAWGVLRWCERILIVVLLVAAPFIAGPFDEVLAGIVIGGWLLRVRARRTQTHLTGECAATLDGGALR